MKETIATGAWQKAFDYNYLGTYAIPSGKENVEVTILKVVKAEEAKIKDKFKTVHLIYLKEFDKPMILNKENCKILTWNYGAKEFEHWIGKKALLFVDPNVESFGTIVEGLRFVKNKERGKFKPEQKQKLELSSPNFETLATWLVEKPERTVAKMKEKYDISPEAEAELIKRKG